MCDNRVDVCRGMVFAAVLAVGAVVMPSAQATTLFLATYDSSKTANVAGGNPNPTNNPAGAVIDTTDVKHGSGSLDPSGVNMASGGLRYESAGNFDPTRGTVEFWLRAPGYDGSVEHRLFSITTRPSFTGDFDMVLDRNAEGRLTVIAQANGQVLWFHRTFVDYQTFGDGNWHHIAWEWDTTLGASSFSTIYVDGIRESSLSHNSIYGTIQWPTNAVLGSEITVGSTRNGDVASGILHPLAGNIDDLRISDVALYQTESFTPPGPFLPLLLGDGNGDGVVDGLDIPIFLAQLNGSQSQTPAMDLNQDSVVDGLDIPPFLSALGGNSATVPEPGSLGLLAATLPFLGRRRTGKRHSTVPE